MSPAPHRPERAPPVRDAHPVRRPDHAAAGSSRVQVVRPRRCAAAGAPPGPAPHRRRSTLAANRNEPPTTRLTPAPVFIESPTSGVLLVHRRFCRTADAGATPLELLQS